MEFGAFTIPDCRVIYKSKHCYVFPNIRPFLPHHLLVSTIRKRQGLLDLTEEEAADLMRTVRKTLRCLRAFGEAATVTLQDGEAAGQTVRHLHFHIIPRTSGDLSNNNDVYKETSLDVVKPNRSDESMEEEAALLRKVFEEEDCL